MVATMAALGQKLGEHFYGRPVLMLNELLNMCHSFSFMYVLYSDV